MDIVTVLNCHGNTDCVLDTVESVVQYVGKKVLLVIDGSHWSEWGKNLQVPVHKLEGFYHNSAKAPYRNVCLGLKQAWDMWKDADWFCYMEYDCLFGSDEFKEYLKDAAAKGVWCLGNDYRMQNFKFPLIERMLRGQFGVSSYLLGCCVFFKNDFIHTLSKLNFFERFLYMTNEFSQGFFPGYDEQGGYDISEHLYPTLATHLGGKIGQLAHWDETTRTWTGEYKKFPFRFRPDLGEIPGETIDVFRSASILHPLKEFSNPIRQYFRNKRKKI